MWWFVALVAVIVGGILSGLNRNKPNWVDSFIVGSALSFFIGLGYFILLYIQLVMSA